MSDPVAQRLEELLGEMRKANVMLETGPNARYSPEYKQMQEVMANTRRPSKAAKIGQGPSGGPSSGEMRGGLAKRVAAGLYGGNRSKLGTIATAFLKMSGRDQDEWAEGKAMLIDAGFFRADLPALSRAYATSYGPLNSDDYSGGFQKATLGTTGTTGGYVLPNNLVDKVVKPSVQRAMYADLVTTVGGVAVRGVDQPYRLGPPARAQFQDWGVSKENVNEQYGSYTATLGTLARIYDASKQYLRFSAGAAEQDIFDELTKSIALGENYYIIAGAGTGSVGVGDPTTGIYTALAAATSFNGYTTAFNSASQSTLVGSFAEAVTQGMEALAKRNRECEAIVVDPVTYYNALGQGTDTAGFWLAPGGGQNVPGAFRSNESGGVSFWGVPIFWDANLGTNATTKIAILGEWSAFRLYRGMEFRIDTSDQAGTRWDQNLVGYRGEEEIGFNASTGVNIGAMQLITSAIA